jgi:CubicO group peptidase (beta-lactamase class C family)
MTSRIFSTSYKLLSLALALGCIAASAQTAIQRLDGTTITAADAESFARKTLADNRVTGAQIAVLNHGQLIWSAAFGLAGKDPNRPMTRNTTTWAASITKALFATYVETLVRQGKFDLDKPIAQQLPRPLDTYEPYRESASLLVKDPQWLLVTPRMLLSHSSGLLNFATIEPDKKMRLHFKPGTSFIYSGEGINLVQFVVEQQQGKPIDQLMQDALFAPLAMTRTALIYNQAFAPDVADRFDLDEKFRSQTRRFPARAAGSMTTSADDLARFFTALFAGRILQPGSLQSMLTPVLQLHQLHQFQFGSHANDEGEESSAVGLAYGVGWGLLTRTKFGPAFFKEGHGDGAQNYAICFRSSQSCMIILTNSDNGELAFRPLLEHILGDTVTPWEWEGYTPAYIEYQRQQP